MEGLLFQSRTFVSFLQMGLKICSFFLDLSFPTTCGRHFFLKHTSLTAKSLKAP